MAPSPIEFGLILSLTIRGLFIGDYESLLAVARKAEGMGFHSLWQCDHFFSVNPKAYAEISGKGDPSADAGGDAGPVTLPMLDSWVAISALARDTKTIRLGHLVNCVGYRSPTLLARMGATLDIISGGRFELGIGAGWLEPEYRSYGFPFPKASVRIAQLAEAIQIIRRMWTDAAPTFEGEHFQVKNAYCDPPPLQKPHPPIWVGGEGKKLLAEAARHADGFNSRWLPPEGFTERLQNIAAVCEKAGRNPAEVRPSLMTMVIPDRNEGAAAGERKRFAVVPDSGVIAGPPEACIERLGKYIEAGVRRILVTIPDVDKVPERLELMGREILPAVRAMG
ncbi:MAG: LLM class flavin-dependent oxidoreductase [bacterium]|nr:LLM class flavin-dependent oxidoreductase [bacterium]